MRCFPKAGRACSGAQEEKKRKAEEAKRKKMEEAKAEKGGDSARSSSGTSGGDRGSKNNQFVVRIGDGEVRKLTNVGRLPTATPRAGRLIGEGVCLVIWGHFEERMMGRRQSRAGPATAARHRACLLWRWARFGARDCGVGAAGEAADDDTNQIISVLDDLMIC